MREDQNTRLGWLYMWPGFSTPIFSTQNLLIHIMALIFCSIMCYAKFFKFFIEFFIKCCKYDKIFIIVINDNKLLHFKVFKISSLLSALLEFLPNSVDVYYELLLWFKIYTSSHYDKVFTWRFCLIQELGKPPLCCAMLERCSHLESILQLVPASSPLKCELIFIQCNMYSRHVKYLCNV